MGVTKLIDHKTLAGMAMQNLEFAEQLLGAGLIDQQTFDDLADIRQQNQITGAEITAIKQDQALKQNEFDNAFAAHTAFITAHPGQHNDALDADLQRTLTALNYVKHKAETADLAAKTVHTALVDKLKQTTNSPSGIGVYLSEAPASRIKNDEGVQMTEQQAFDKAGVQIARGEEPDRACFAKLGEELKRYVPVHKGVGPRNDDPNPDPTQPDATEAYIDAVTTDKVMRTVAPSWQVKYDGTFGGTGNDSIGAEEITAAPVWIAHARVTKQLADVQGEDSLYALQRVLTGDTTLLFEGMIAQDRENAQLLSTEEATGGLSGRRQDMFTKGLATLRGVQIGTFTPTELQENYGIDPESDEAVALQELAKLQHDAEDFITDAKFAKERALGFEGPVIGGGNALFTAQATVEELQKLHDKAHGAAELLLLGTDESVMHGFTDEQMEAAHKVVDLKMGGVSLEQMKTVRDNMFDKSLELFCEESLRLGAVEVNPTQKIGELNRSCIAGDLGLKAAELLYSAPDAEKAKRARFVIEGMAQKRKQLADEFAESRRKQGVAKAAETAVKKEVDVVEAKVKRLQDQLNSTQHRTARQQRKLQEDWMKAREEAGAKRQAAAALRQEQLRLQEEQKTLKSHSHLEQQARAMRRELETAYLQRTHKEHRDERRTQANPYAKHPSRVFIDCTGRTATKGNDYKSAPSFHRTFAQVKI